MYLLKGAGLRGLGPGDAVVLPGWEHPAAWQLLAEAAVRGVATVAFYESNRQSQRFGRGPVAAARAWFFRHVDAVLTVGRASSSVVATFGVDDDHVVMTHNSIDVRVFAAHGPGESDASASPKRFAYVGQLIERKNVDSLVRALALCPDDFELHVIGEGPLDRELRDLARNLDISSRVNFDGYLEPEALAARIREVSTVVLPSTTEVYGLAPIEALALGRHAIVSSAAGVAIDIADMPGVWITEPVPAALAAAMRASSVAWDGPVPDPPVLGWTPERFAEDAIRATDLAVARRRARGRLRRSIRVAAPRTVRSGR